MLCYQEWIGTIQFKFWSNGNYVGSFSYSLSNIFQLKFINIESFKNVNRNNYFISSITNTYLKINIFHVRLGGKFLLFAPQKDDKVWTSFKIPAERNEDTNQGYIFYELINKYL